MSSDDSQNNQNQPQNAKPPASNRPQGKVINENFTKNTGDKKESNEKT
jgi:hypothetical protein